MAKTKRYISTDELKNHNKAGDLWISIQGKCHTNWGKEHPGGDAPLLNLAGQDVIDAFIAYHPGTAWKYLDRFFIGYLSNYKVSEVSKDYRRLASQFSKMGLFEKKGHGVFISICALTMLFAISISGVLLSDCVWSHLSSAVLLGFLWMQTGFIGHDSGHYQIMLSPRFNRLAQIISGNCLTGICIAWWKWTHNAHHLACNTLDFDPHLQHIPIFVVRGGYC